MPNYAKPDDFNPPGSSPAAHPMAALLSLIDEETRQYETAVGKLREKQNILIAGKPKLLGRIDQELMAIGRKAKQLEKQRLGYMAELGHPRQTLSQMVETLAPQEPQAASALMISRDRLLRAVQDTQRLNHDTQDLLNLSLQWIQDTVEVIASVLSPEASSYNAQGSKAGAKSQSTQPAHPMQSTINHSV